jgi:hypothetical protein
LSHKISTTLDTKFCIGNLETAFKISKPEIFISDQGLSLQTMILQPAKKQRNSYQLWIVEADFTTIFLLRDSG